MPAHFSVSSSSSSSSSFAAVVLCALALIAQPCAEASFGFGKKHHRAAPTRPSGEFLVLKSEPGAELRKEAVGIFQLIAGTLLVELDQPAEIRVQDCVVKAKGGSSLLITLKNGIGCVSVLTEKNDQSVDVVYGNRSLHLRSGRQVWFGRQEAQVTAAFMETPGRPKLLRKYEAPNVGIIGEFLYSPATIMDTNDLILSMKESELSSERQLYADIVKTSAALTMVHP